MPDLGQLVGRSAAADEDLRRAGGSKMTASRTVNRPVVEGGRHSGSMIAPAS